MSDALTIVLPFLVLPQLSKTLSVPFGKADIVGVLRPVGAPRVDILDVQFVNFKCFGEQPGGVKFGLVIYNTRVLSF